MMTFDEVLQHARFNAYSRIRGDMIASMCEHAITGLPVGGFLTSFFANDLFGAVSRADTDNRVAIANLAMFAVNVLPRGVRMDGWAEDRQEVTRNWLADPTATPPWAAFSDTLLAYWMTFGSGRAVEAAREALGFRIPGS